MFKHGADVTAHPGLFSAALQGWCSRDNNEQLQILLDRGFDINAPIRIKNCAPTTCLRFADKNRQLELFHYLFSQGAELKMPSPPSAPWQPSNEIQPYLGLLKLYDHYRLLFHGQGAFSILPSELSKRIWSLLLDVSIPFIHFGPKLSSCLAWVQHIDDPILKTDLTRLISSFKMEHGFYDWDDVLIAPDTTEIGPSHETCYLEQVFSVTWMNPRVKGEPPQLRRASLHDDSHNEDYNFNGIRPTDESFKTLCLQLNIKSEKLQFFFFVFLVSFTCGTSWRSWIDLKTHLLTENSPIPEALVERKWFSQEIVNSIYPVMERCIKALDTGFEQINYAGYSIHQHKLATRVVTVKPFPEEN